MKTTTFFGMLLLSMNAFAGSGLESAFQQALNESDRDKSSSLTTITVEENARLASWSKQVKKTVVLPTTATVDMPYSVTRSASSSSSSQIDTDHYVSKELSEIK